MSRTVGLVAAIAMLLLLATPAAAERPSTVEITVEAHFSQPSPFQATGLPGGGCLYGTATEQDPVYKTTPAGLTQVVVTKQFACGDGNGSFALLLTAWFGGPLGRSIGHWQVISGNGVFDGLRGSGQLHGTYTCGDECIDDTYTGRVRPG